MALGADRVRIIVTGDGVEMGSSEEALFYGLMRLWKFPVERAGRSEAVKVDGNGWYCPGFYLPGLNIWADVKGFEDDGDRAGYAAWRAEGHKLAVLRREDLHVLMTRADASGVWEQLRIWAR